MLGWIQSAAGLLRDAAATYRHGLEMGMSLSSDGRWKALMAFVHLGLADVLYEWNDLVGAAQHATQGLQICQAARNEELESNAFVTLARVKQARGDQAGAFDLMQKAAQLAHTRDMTVEQTYNATRRARLLIAQNRINEAAQVLNELPLEDHPAFAIEQPFAFFIHATVIARTQVLIAQGEFERAARVLEALSHRAQAEAETGTLIETLVLLALAYHWQGDAVQARTALVRALTHAEPEGYMRTFVDLGEEMRIMISRYRFSIDNEAKGVIEYADKLLAAFPIPATESENHKSKTENRKWRSR